MATLRAIATPPTPDLSRFAVGIAADRRGEDQAVLFRRLGAEVVLGPTMATAEVPDPDRLKALTLALIASPPDYLIANTGIGVRTWLARASDWGVGAELDKALRSVRIVSRGPKASGALAAAGLKPWWRCPTEQLADVVAHLEADGLAGRRVVFQLHGDDGAVVADRLRSAGAAVEALPVYSWGPPPDPGPALAMVDRCCSGTLDAMTFTAGPQVEFLFALAGRRAEELRDALNRPATVVGCIGPVCAEAAARAGIEAPVVPEHWRLGSLVKTVAAALVGGA